MTCSSQSTRFHQPGLTYGINYEVPHCGAFSTPHSHRSWAKIFASGSCIQYPRTSEPSCLFISCNKLQERREQSYLEEGQDRELNAETMACQIPLRVPHTGYSV